MDEISQIKQLNLADIIGRYLPLRKQGKYFVARCPFHKENTSSFKVNTHRNRWRCFGACATGGDAVDFVVKFRNITTPEAIREILGPAGAPIPPPREYQAPPESGDVWIAETPVPDSASPAPIPSTAASVYTYRNQAGQLLGYTARFNMPDGKKEFHPFTFGRMRSTDAPQWSRRIWNQPRPLYGLDRLAAKPGHVALCEGEKTADAASALFPHMAAMSWPGGTNAVQMIDWTPLQGHWVYYFPDNDEAGWKVAEFLREELPKHGALGPRFVIPEAGRPKGWDIADEKWTPAQAMKWASSRMADAIPARTWPKPAPISPGPQAPPPTPTATNPNEDIFFRVLGFDTTDAGSLIIYILSHGTGKVLATTAGGISKSTIMTFAPLSYWEDYYGGKKGINMDQVQNSLIQQAQARGIFNPEIIRGRGAWMDAGRVIIHAGDHLIVDGRPIPIQDHKSRFIYEAKASMEIPGRKPAPATEAREFLEFCKRLRWTKRLSAYLLAGWITIAPICGALRWRPHIWVTGPAGSGKSWVLNNVVKPSMGKIFVNPQGNTSEAAIRQVLVRDSLPVVFDEVEMVTPKDSQRIQEILGLMRSSSTEGGGKIFKGSGSGRVSAFDIRSMFAFASVFIQLKQSADRRRISVLSLIPDTEPGHRERFQKIKAERARILTPEFIEGLQSRSIAMVPTILENARIFAAAITDEFGSQPLGDQIGTLLAGAFSLVSNKPVTYERATDFIREQDWLDERQTATATDEQALFDKVMASIIRVPDRAGQFDRAVATLCLVTSNHLPGEYITKELADAELRRHMIKVEHEKIYIGAPSDFLDRILMGSPWAANPVSVLYRMPGAEIVQATEFSPAVKRRAVAIPLAVLESDAATWSTPRAT